MRLRTLRLLTIVSGIYIFFLILLRSLIPEKLTSSITLLGLPLVILALILVSDLSYRATTPSKTISKKEPTRFQARDVQYLSRQVQVASEASQAYFESVLLSRLRDILVDKVSLETGMEKEKVKRELADRSQGPSLTRDQRLYMLLYSSIPSKGATRIKMIHEALDLIEALKA